MVLTKHRKPRFVLMSYEYYERMRTGGDPRSASEMPEEHRELFAAEIDRLARPASSCRPGLRLSTRLDKLSFLEKCVHISH